MTSPKVLRGLPPRVKSAAYEVALSERGLPLLQLELAFKHEAVVRNPAMELALVVNDGVSMWDAHREGELVKASDALFDAVFIIQARPRLILFNEDVTDAGTPDKGQAGWAIDRGRRHGDSYLADALALLVDSRGDSAVFAVVVTDGGIEDPAEVCDLIEQTKPALSVLFIGAGGELVYMDKLQQIVAYLRGKGVPLVAAAEVGERRAAIAEAVDKTLLGEGLECVVSSDESVTRIGDLNTGTWFDGSRAELGFLPRNIRLAVEYGPDHPERLPVHVTFKDASSKDQEVRLEVPLPKVAGAALVDNRSFLSRMSRWISG